MMNRVSTEIEISVVIWKKIVSGQRNNEYLFNSVFFNITKRNIARRIS